MDQKQKYNKILMQWEAGWKNKDPNALLWTIFIVAIVIAAMIYYFVIKEWTTSAVFIFMLLALIWYIAMSPKKAKVAIADKGILLNNQFYDFQNMEGYWFAPKSEILYIAPKNKASMILAIPTEGQSLERIKPLLPSYILEIEDRGENIVDRITRVLHM